jgi:DNA-binding response OmpR family regulator
MDREIILRSRILIVDDNQANVLLLERVLQQAGYKNYVSLTDSRQFLDQFRMFQPDLILLDLMMPKLDGYALIKQLNGWIPDTAYLPILVVTADTSRSARQKALTLGAKDFLTKPIDTAEATLRVYNLLLTRCLYRQMESKNQFSAAQASLTRVRLQAVLLELDQVTAKGQAKAADIMRLRSQLTQAMDAAEARDSNGTGGSPSISSLPAVPGASEGGTKEQAV